MLKFTKLFYFMVALYEQQQKSRREKFTQAIGILM